MKRTFALFALGGALYGVESKLLRFANNKRDADWRPAEATVAVNQLLQHMSPKPTAAPRAPDAPGLHRRASTDNTCGYISGITASSLYCNIDNACVYDKTASYIGCCPDVVLNNTSTSLSGTSSLCPIWTTCFDSTESARYTTDNGLTMFCEESSYPNCIQHIYRDSTFSGYTLWGCAGPKAARTDFVYYKPTVLTSITTSDSSTTTSSRRTNSAGASTTTDPSSTASADPATTSTDPAVTPKKKSSNTGAIVGGVVGGVGALALIGLAAFFLLRKKKSKSEPAAAAATTSSVAPAQSLQPGAPGGGAGYYDPKQPQMAEQQQGGQYGYAPAGFAPVDPRASIAKPPYAVQQSEYNPNYNNNNQQFSSEPGSPSPGSPAPAYNGAPGATPPPAGAYGQQAYSPEGTGYNQPYQAGQYNQGGYPSPPTQAQPYGQQHPAGGYPTQFAAELPTQRGDGQVRELAG